MEESLQPAGVAVAEFTHGSRYVRDVVRERVARRSPKSSTPHAAQNNIPRAAQPDSSLNPPELDNRRTNTRHACRLSAEVYRPGLSIPHRCCITDLSPGGCFLEVALPFPQGAPLEIVVRTYEMRLRLKGTVLASHPGFGMGVAFELDTQEGRARLKELTEFVATAEPSN